MFELNKVYKFNTLAPSILGEFHTLMKVALIMNADRAIRFEDVHTKNAKLLSQIPGLSSNATDNTYVLFETNDGEEVLLAQEWIDKDTVQVVGETNIRIDIPNKDTSDIDVIKTALNELGYKDYQVTTY